MTSSHPQQQQQQQQQQRRYRAQDKASMPLKQPELNN